MRPQRSIFPAIALLCLPVIETSSSPESCLLPVGAGSFKATSLNRIPQTPCYLATSNVKVLIEETSYPLGYWAMRSIFASLSNDIGAHPVTEPMSSTLLWYFGEYPYNNTELFVRMQHDIMTWGQWEGATNILAFFYDTFSTVSLSFEVWSSLDGVQRLAQGRFSLYDRI
ncbi:hypothetical protein JMJ35_005810 [Cladonia borealis]|uniref:Uncharacterized protein n=1 Tax=Cladonia borealis TaxID=184061 RepID=A0AA39QXU2_9LECA|nr:hypothetical protein JMJ35_005810 [Cladonia borealis]